MIPDEELEQAREALKKAKVIDADITGDHDRFENPILQVLLDDGTVLYGNFSNMRTLDPEKLKKAKASLGLI